MDELFKHILDWIGAHPGWAYLVVFVVALSESLAVVGMLVPGVMIMLGAGALIATGSLAFWPTCIAAILGAVAGDGFSYWLGHHYRERIRTLWPFVRYPKQLDQGIAFFERYGAKSVAFGRFVGPGRAVIPLVAGMMQMSPRRFLVANISSAVAWAPAYLAPGIVFGASLKLAAEAAARLVILLLILVGLIWFAVWAARQVFMLLSPHASAWVQAMLNWANVHPRVGRVAQALADPDHPDAATLAALALALLAATAVLGLSVSAGLFGAQDLAINQIALDLGQSLHAPLADNVMAGLSRLGDTTVTLPVAVAVLLYLLAAGHRRDAGYWAAAAGFAAVATPALGWLLKVPRPELGLGLHWPWSFPAGQVLSATLVYGFLAVALSRGISGPARWVPGAVATVLVLAVALARWYFGAEWLTDIVGSLALGLAWIAALGIAFRRHTQAVPAWGRLAGVAAVTVGIAFTAASLTRHQADLAALSPSRAECVADLKAWRSRSALPVPSHRKDLLRRVPEPFDLQYAGPLDRLVAALEPAGWRPADMLGWSNAIRLLSPSLPLAELPVIPHVHDGHHEDLTLVKDLGNGQRLVLRLWSTGCDIPAGDTSAPLWVGNATVLRKDNVVDLIALPITEPRPEPARVTLEWDLKAAPGLLAEPGQPLLLAPAGGGLLDLAGSGRPPLESERPAP